MAHEPVGPSSALVRCNLGGAGISGSAILIRGSDKSTCVDSRSLPPTITPLDPNGPWRTNPTTRVLISFLDRGCPVLQMD